MLPCGWTTLSVCSPPGDAWCASWSCARSCSCAWSCSHAYPLRHLLPLLHPPCFSVFALRMPLKKKKSGVKCAVFVAELPLNVLVNGSRVNSFHAAGTARDLSIHYCTRSDGVNERRQGERLCSHGDGHMVAIGSASANKYQQGTLKRRQRWPLNMYEFSS